MFRRIRTPVALLGLLLSAAPAFADAINISFESYPTGKIANGSNGWQITSAKWDQQVTGAGAIAGAQSWRISDRVTGGSFGDQPFTPALLQKAGESGAAGATTNFFSASMLFRPLAGGVNGEGTTISIDNGTGQRGNYLRIENAGGGDGNWQVRAFDYSGVSDTFFDTVLAAGLNAGDIHELAFDMTFKDGADNDVWRVYLDGNLVYTGRGWEDFFRDGFPTFGPSPAAYDRLLFRAGGGASIPDAAGVLFDNIQYGSSSAQASMPEPGTLALFGLAALGAYGYHRRRRRT